MTRYDFDQPERHLDTRGGEKKTHLPLLPNDMKERTTPTSELKMDRAWVKTARGVQARTFLREVLLPRVAQNETLTAEGLRDALIEWRQTHRGEEGGANLALSWVEGEGLLLEIQNENQQNAGWYVESACLLKKTLDQLADVNILAIDYEMEMGQPPTDQ